MPPACHSRARTALGYLYYITVGAGLAIFLVVILVMLRCCAG